MSFKYRLAPLLKIREHVRAEKQAELNKAHEAARLVEEELERVRGEYAHSMEQGLQAAQQEEIDVNYLLGLRRHQFYLISQQELAIRQLEEIKQEIEHRRIALMEADRQVKVLEKLRDKMKAKYLQEEALADLKQMDEIAGRTKTNV